MVDIYIPQNIDLVQRLKSPDANNTYDSGSFTDGRSGFSVEQRILLGRIFRLDSRHNSDTNIEDRMIERSFNDIESYSRNRHNAFGLVELEKPVYYYCHENSVDKAINTLRYMAQTEDKYLDEKSTLFEYTINGKSEPKEPKDQIKGWLFINRYDKHENFLAFADKTMAMQFKELFEGIKIKKSKK